MWAQHIASATLKKTGNRKWGQTMQFQVLHLPAPPMCILPPGSTFWRSLIFPKQCRKIGIKCSNTWACGSHFTFNPQHLVSLKWSRNPLLILPGSFWVCESYIPITSARSEAGPGCFLNSTCIPTCAWTPAIYKEAAFLVCSWWPFFPHWETILSCYQMFW